MPPPFFDHFSDAGHVQDHLQNVTTITLVEKRPLNLDAVNRWIGTMLWEEGRAEDIFRMVRGNLSHIFLQNKKARWFGFCFEIKPLPFQKGLLQLEGDNRIHILQAVHEYVFAHFVLLSDWLCCKIPNPFADSLKSGNLENGYQTKRE